MRGRVSHLSFIPQSLMPGTHLFCVYGDNWFQSVRYSLRCLVAVPQDTDCVETIKTTEEKLAIKKKELEKFQVKIKFSMFYIRYFLFQSEFCEIKKKYDTAKERLETDVKEITELIQDREGAYTDYQDASALKYSHVQATARSVSRFRNILLFLIFNLF